MSDEKRATLKKVLLGVMSIGALSRVPAHAATPHAGVVGGMTSAQTETTSGNVGSTPAAMPHGGDSMFGEFHDAFHNADPYHQTFGDLFVLEGPFFEFGCW